jgi:hypothetical protein
VIVASAPNENSLSSGARYRLQFAHIGLAIRIVPVEQNGDDSGLRYQFAHQFEPLFCEGHIEHVDARDVSDRPIEAGNEPEFHWVAADEKNDRYRRSRSFCCKSRRRAAESSDDGHLTVNQIGSERGQSIVSIFRPPLFDLDVLILSVADLA